MATLNQLLAAKTRDEILASVLLEMAKPEHTFPLTDVSPGSVWRTLIEGDVAALQDLYKFVPVLAASGYIDLAQGDWLELRAASFYDTLRKPSVFAEVELTLTVAPGFGPYDVPVGGMWALAQPDKRFVNTQFAVLLSNTPTKMRFRAESPGSAYNVAAGTVNKLLTPLPGVSVTNLDASLLVAGADVESDANLRRRCKLKWPALGSGGSKAAYELWAREASPSVTKVLVKDWHPRGEGTLDVIVWGDGGVGTEVVEVVKAYINLRKMAYDVRVAGAASITVPLQGNVTVQAGLLEQAQLEAQSYLDALQAELNIGATVYRSELIERIQDAAGVVNTVLAAPAADVLLPIEGAAVFDNQLVWQAVA